MLVGGILSTSLRNIVSTHALCVYVARSGFLLQPIPFHRRLVVVGVSSRLVLGLVTGLSWRGGVYQHGKQGDGQEGYLA